MYVKPKQISLKSSTAYSESWVQSIIADDPSVLGLGDLVLRDRERIQPRAGRLDLLLQDAESKRRYEVELQLGSTDESHIIRTIEYWDIERKRYPQYDHCAVLIAEDITSRFLNVVALFNGVIPFIAIQMQALQIGEHTTLVFTKVLDELSLGMVDEDEDAEAAPTDRNYWEAKATATTLQLADRILEIAKKKDQSFELKFNKFYIGIARDGQPFNFITMRPKKNHINLEVKIEKNDENDTFIENADIETLEYNNHYGFYVLRLVCDDFETKHEAINELVTRAYHRRSK